MYTNEINATSQLYNQSEKDEAALNEMTMYAIFHFKKEEKHIQGSDTKLTECFNMDELRYRFIN